MVHLHNQFALLLCVVNYCTCAAVESQLGGGVEFLDQELGQRYSVVCVQ